MFVLDYGNRVGWSPSHLQRSGISCNWKFCPCNYWWIKCKVHFLILFVQSSMEQLHTKTSLIWYINLKSYNAKWLLKITPCKMLTKKLINSKDGQIQKSCCSFFHACWWGWVIRKLAMKKYLMQKGQWIKMWNWNIPS